MKKICLVVVGLYINLLSGFSQSTDSANYKSRKLRLEEINLVHSYYHQEGDNSAVTGGIGTEKLSDLANNIELKLNNYDKHGRKREWDLTIGVDYYTSASSDKIDPYTISSASARDLRVYPSLAHTVTNEIKGTATEFNASYSVESDYQSYGFGAGFSKRSVDRNRELMVKAQCYLDQVKLILPIELRTPATGGYPGYNFHDYPWSDRNTYSGSFSLSQMMNKRLQLKFILDLAYQQGFLSMPFHRVYYKDNTTPVTERLPSSRFKLPVGLRLNYFFGDKIILRSFYRFYTDDWGLTAHTADIETAIQLTPFFSVSPFYRYYTQTAIRYFAPYQEHATADNFYSSNYDLSKLNSHFFGAGIRLAPPKGILGMKQWNLLELRYGHYSRSNGLKADILSLNLKFTR